MTTEDLAHGQESIPPENISTVITSKITSAIQKHSSLIGSPQFSNAKPGFGTEEDQEGYAGHDGLIDVYKIIAKAVIPANIPYLIPEFQEKDYGDPHHQREAIEWCRKLVGER